MLKNKIAKISVRLIDEEGNESKPIEVEFEVLPEGEPDTEGLYIFITNEDIAKISA